jgi:hypothetical protein
MLSATESSTGEVRNSMQIQKLNSKSDLSTRLGGGSMPEEKRRSTRSLSDRYAEILELPLPLAETRKRGLPQDATWGDAIALEMVKVAANGNAQAIREIRESIEGKAPQRPPEPEYNKINIKIINIGGKHDQELNSQPSVACPDIVKSKSL